MRTILLGILAAFLAAITCVSPVQAGEYAWQDNWTGQTWQSIVPDQPISISGYEVRDGPLTVKFAMAGWEGGCNDPQRLGYNADLGLDVACVWWKHYGLSKNTDASREIYQSPIPFDRARIDDIVTGKLSRVMADRINQKAIRDSSGTIHRLHMSGLPEWKPTMVLQSVDGNTVYVYPSWFRSRDQFGKIWGVGYIDVVFTVAAKAGSTTRYLLDVQSMRFQTTQEFEAFIAALSDGSVAG